VIRNLLTPLMMVVTLLFWAGGCSDSPIEPGASENLNLEDEFGGYTASMENPALAIRSWWMKPRVTRYTTTKS